MGARGLDLLEQGPPSPMLGDTGTFFFFAGRQGVCKPWGTVALSNSGLSSSNLGVRILR